MVRPVVAALVLAVVLAGCSSKQAPAAETEVAGVDVKATQTTGVIRGLVVDLAIRPVVGATVRESPGNHTTQTNAAGAFGFAGLAPGVHFLSVSKPGYVEVQQSVEVEAGVDDPDPVRVQVAQLPSGKPYHDVVKFRGHQAFAVTLSLPPNDVLGEHPRFVANVPALFNGSIVSTVTYAPIPTWEQNLVIWEPNSVASQRLQVDQCLYREGEDCDDEGTVYFNSTFGTSPLVLTADETLRSAWVGNGSLVDEIVVWATGATGAHPNADAGATFNQDYVLITVRTYNYAPPEGYRFDVDGEPVDPE